MSTLNTGEVAGLASTCGSFKSGVENWLKDHLNDLAEYKGKTRSRQKRQRDVHDLVRQTEKRKKLAKLPINVMNTHGLEQFAGVAIGMLLVGKKSKRQ